MSEKFSDAYPALRRGKRGVEARICYLENSGAELCLEAMMHTARSQYYDAVWRRFEEADASILEGATHLSSEELMRQSRTLWLLREKQVLTAKLHSLLGFECIYVSQYFRKLPDPQELVLGDVSIAKLEQFVLTNGFKPEDVNLAAIQLSIDKLSHRTTDATFQDWIKEEREEICRQAEKEASADSPYFRELIDDEIRQASLLEAIQSETRADRNVQAMLSAHYSQLLADRLISKFGWTVEEVRYELAFKIPRN